MLQWLIANKLEVIVALLGVSESLALIPAFKANGILDGLIKALKAAKDALAPKV